MRKLFTFLCLLGALCVSGFSQQFERSTKGQIDVADTDCSGLVSAAPCVGLRLPLGAASASATVTAMSEDAFNGFTLQFEASLDNVTYVAIAGAPASSGTAVTSVTDTAGVWRFSVSGFRYLRVRCSARVTAGAAEVFLLGSTAPLRIGATAGP